MDICGYACNTHAVWLDSKLSMDEKKQRDREERESLVLWKKPLLTLHYFTLELLITLQEWIWRWDHGWDTASRQKILSLQTCTSVSCIFHLSSCISSLPLKLWEFQQCSINKLDVHFGAKLLKGERRQRWKYNYKFHAWLDWESSMSVMLFHIISYYSLFCLAKKRACLYTNHLFVRHLPHRHKEA